MQLSKLSFRQFEDDPRAWFLENLSLEHVNLIVGRNSSGKTRTLNVIYGLALMMSGRRQVPLSSCYNCKFSHEGNEWSYDLITKDSLVVEERLLKGDTLLFTRGERGEGKIWAEDKAEMLKFQTPQTALAVFARQDSVQHSYLKVLLDWANGTFHYPFGKELGQSMLAAHSPLAPPPDFYDSNQTTGVFSAGKGEFGDKYVSAIISDMCAMGYDVSDVGVMVPASIQVVGAMSGSVKCLYVQEKSLEAKTEQLEMSQGMFRALSIFIHLNYGLLSGKSGCVIIDDIGEGLDFERSNSVIKRLVQKFSETSLQLLMTTNDRFVMNSVPLKYWSILDRKGSKVYVFNERNAAKQFEEFKFTGLSNFDFLATDFIHSADAS